MHAAVVPHDFAGQLSRTYVFRANGVCQFRFGSILAQCIRVRTGKGNAFIRNCVRKIIGKACLSTSGQRFQRFALCVFNRARRIHNRHGVAWLHGGAAGF